MPPEQRRCGANQPVEGRAERLPSGKYRGLQPGCEKRQPDQPTTVSSVGRGLEQWLAVLERDKRMGCTQLADAVIAQVRRQQRGARRAVGPIAALAQPDRRKGGAAGIGGDEAAVGRKAQKRDAIGQGAAGREGERADIAHRNRRRLPG